MNPVIKQWLKGLSAIAFVVAFSTIAKSQNASPNPVCYGEPIYLFCNLSGCAVPSASFSWSNFTGSWTSTLQDPVIPPSGIGYATDFFYLQVSFSPPPGGFSGGRIKVTILPEIVITGTTTPVSCSPGNDGCIYTSTTGGSPPFNYNWSNGPTTKDICNLGCGIYTVTVTDFKSCKAVKSFEVSTGLVLTGTIHKASCSPGNDAWIDVTVSGGCSPLSYTWSNGSTTQDISGIPCGWTYYVTVYDAAGCFKSASFTYEDVILNAVVTDAAPGCNNGSIDLTVSCGTPPFTYQWMKVGSAFSAFTEDIYGLSPGWYCVTVIDFHSISRICCWAVGGKKSTCQSNYLQDLTVPGGTNTCYSAIQDIVVAGNGTTFLVQSGGSATMVAGHKVSYLPGTMVYPGGTMHGYITTNGQYCNNKNTGGDIGSEETISDSIPKADGTENRDFRIYPNPTTGTFILELTDVRVPSKVNVEIYSIRDEKIATSELKGVKKQEFSLSDKPTGIYFIRVVSGNFAGTGKIVKQ